MNTGESSTSQTGNIALLLKYWSWIYQMAGNNARNMRNIEKDDSCLLNLARCGQGVEKEKQSGIRRLIK
jgi:hypothetical protein